MALNTRLEELWTLVQAIPPGRVVGYGQLGKELTNPVSGLLVGKWMAMAPEGVPWWRVVGGDGSLKTAKRGPEFGKAQQKLLEDEGVEFDGEVIPPRHFV